MKPAEIVNTTGRYLLYLLLLITPLLRGSVLPWHHTLIQIFAFILLAIALLEIHLSGQTNYQKSGLEKPLLAFLALYTISVFLTKSLPETIDASLMLLAYGCIFYAAINLIKIRKHRKHLVYVIIGIALLLSIIAILKSTSPQTFPWWNYKELSYPKEMLSGPYGNHNHLAGYLEMSIPLTISLLVYPKGRFSKGAILIPISLILITVHLLTLSRGGWFSLTVALMFMAFAVIIKKESSRKKVFIGSFVAFITIALFVLSGSVLFERALTLSDNETLVGMGGRTDIWKSSLEMILDYPLFGIGPGTFTSVFPQYQLAGTTSRFYYAHNDLLQFIVEVGLLQIVIFFWGIYIMVSKKLTLSGLTLGAAIGILAISVHSIVDFNMHIPANVLLFIMLFVILLNGLESRRIY